MKAWKIIFIVFFIVLNWSCLSVKYVPVETVKTDSIYINKILRDSVYQRDSIYIHDKGDTIFVEKYQYLYVDKLIQDTLYISRADSIQIPYPVEKALTKWESIKLELGGWVFVIIIVLILITVSYLVYRT